ncbi:MAG: methionyl-tRNA formyltransferase [Peptococcaceae bacterium]|jgi:methionyl-tRNA formyltransferase|nr:methionyl-tRNA formyltransferase [Peptococcaceae bacterium]
MRFIFMGTPDFAVTSLRALAQAGREIVGVFTQPDRQAGRGKRLQPSAVKTAALELGLPVYQPEKIKTAESSDLLRSLHPDCLIVVAYGQILSPEILALPPRGCINVHASLLPAYRGAAPIHWAVMHGQAMSGVTTMLMDEGLDTGDILLQRACPIGPQTTSGELHDRLAEEGAQLLVETLAQWEQGSLRSIAQQGESSYAPRLGREDERLDWRQCAGDVHNRIRGLNPWPGAYTTWRNDLVKVWRSQTVAPISFKEVPGAAQPGQIIRLSEEGLLVQTGQGQIILRELQPTGKRRMSAQEFWRGRRIQPGELLGESGAEEDRHG